MSSYGILLKNQVYLADLAEHSILLHDNLVLLGLENYYNLIKIYVLN